MAPSTTSPRAVGKIRKAHQIPGRSLESHKATEATTGPRPATTMKTDSELAETFKSDLQKIQNLITCTICNQLLYEPWTLTCGHTYCYSCLCSWFVPNKRKKTCPDCRTLVKEMPAPAFLIKQTVEVFIDRVELMPIDETPDQHRERRRTESEVVEADRASDAGLFKGCFSKQPIARLQFNEEDRIYRCSQCGHEHIAGPMCENCGLDFQGDEEDIDSGGFSDVDDEESLDGFEYGDFHADLDETDEDDEDIDDIDGVGPAHFWGPSSPLPGHAAPPAIIWASATPSRSSDGSSSENSDDEEETESMQGFIDDDDHQSGRLGSYRSPMGAPHASVGFGGPEAGRTDDEEEEDDEYDEGGAVSNGRRRSRPPWASRGTPSLITVTNSATTSEAGDTVDESRHLQESGWSPLEQEPESDCGEHQPFVRHSEDNDSDTTVGNQASDDDDDEEEEEEEEEEEDEDENSTRGKGVTWGRSRMTALYYEHDAPGQSRRSDMADKHSDNGAYDSEAREANMTDPEGDVEMSVSPLSSRRSSAANSGADRRPRRSVEILGSANTIHDIGDESSDGTVQPANRRRRQPRYSRYSHTPEYDPRISMMFAQHQLDLRDVTARQSPYFEPASRSRISSSYRHMPSRGPFASGNAHLPSAAILTSVSDRPNRIQRQYPRRYYYN